MRHFQFALFLTSLIFTNLYGQRNVPYVWYLAESNGGLCNQSLLLFKDSTYCSERGCEASSHFAFGKWTQKNNLIKLIPADPTRYGLISKIERQKTNDNKLVVVILDKDGNNITNEVYVGQYVAGKGLYPLVIDSLKTSRTDLIRENSTLLLTSLQRLFKQKIEITRDSSNYFKIYLTISRYWNFSGNSDWDNDTEFSLIKKNDRLVTTKPTHFGDKGSPVPSEYVLQKE